MKIYTRDGIGHEVRNHNKRKMEYGGQRGGVPGGCKDKKKRMRKRDEPDLWHSAEAHQVPNWARISPNKAKIIRNSGALVRPSDGG